MRPAATLFAALLAGAPLWAGADAGSWAFTPAFVSQYMFRGVRLGGPSLQPALEFSRGALTAGIWGSIPLRDHVADGSESEFDFYASYTVELPHGLSLVPGFNLYTYPDAAKSDGYYPLTVEPSLGLNCTIGPVQFSPKLTATIGTFRLSDIEPDTSPAIKNWGDYRLVGVAVPYQFSPHSSITIGWAYTTGTNNYLKQGTAGREANPDAVGRGVFTLSYTCTF
ncbi:MAG: hypothetical protein HYV75_02170 [Opitutae bacterium]|nr:hypothetical protein [Opitutae bacterium]